MARLSSTKNEKYFEAVRHEVMPYIPSDAKTFLDIGCATGIFGSLLKAREPQAIVWGAEISLQVAEVARQCLDEVIAGDVTQSIDLFPDNYFDCIVCNDSLEHLNDPFTFLKQIKTKLSRTGVIVSSIPNIRYYKVLSNLLFKKQFHYEDAGILDRTHLRFFTKNSIRDMYEDLGYNIEVHEGIRATRKGKIRLLILLTFGWWDDIRFHQFVTRVRPKQE